MNKKLKIAVGILLFFTLYNLAITGYFLWGYIQVDRFVHLGMPAWRGLVNAWLFVGLKALLLGTLSFIAAIFVLRRKKLGFWLALSATLFLFTNGLVTLSAADRLFTLILTFTELALLLILFYCLIRSKNFFTA